MERTGHCHLLPFPWGQLPLETITSHRSLRRALKVVLDAGKEREGNLTRELEDTKPGWARQKNEREGRYPRGHGNRTRRAGEPGYREQREKKYSEPLPRHTALNLRVRGSCS